MIHASKMNELLLPNKNAVLYQHGNAHTEVLSVVPAGEVGLEGSAGFADIFCCRPKRDELREPRNTYSGKRNRKTLQNTNH